MAFVTRAEIEGQFTINEAAGRARTLHAKATSDRHYIFLSHSHRDKQLVAKVVALLGDPATAGQGDPGIDLAIEIVGH